MLFRTIISNSNIYKNCKRHVKMALERVRSTSSSPHFTPVKFSWKQAIRHFCLIAWQTQGPIFLKRRHSISNMHIIMWCYWIDGRVLCLVTERVMSYQYILTNPIKTYHILRAHENVNELLWRQHLIFRPLVIWTKGFPVWLLKI